MDLREAEALLALTSEIYDAALDALLWPGALESVARFVGGSAANMFAQDIESGRPTVAFQCGIDPAYERSYTETYFRLNPLAPIMATFDVGLVNSQSDVMSYEEFYRTRFYLEWVRPQGFVDVIGANLDRTATRFATIGVPMHERDGRVTGETRRRMGLVVPHLRRAAAIGQVLDFNSNLVDALTEALDGLKSGVVLVDSDRRVVFANDSARSLLAVGNVIRQADGRLSAVDRRAGQALLEAVSAARRGDAAVGQKGAAVPVVSTTGERWIANILPLTSGARRRAGRRHAAVAAVFIRRASLSTPSALEAVASLYRLTPSEQRVLHAMVEVGGVAATADALGVSEPTVKTHLRNLFEKTGVNRQAELVKLVASTSQSLAG